MINRTSGISTLKVIELKKTGIPIIALVCLLSAVSCRPAAEPTARPRPNIILFSIDTLRADRLGCYGYNRPTSPEIDRFAKDAVFFANAYSQAPITTPSHMSLFTALSPPVHGVNNICPEGLRHRLDDGVVSIVETLKDRGYINVGMHGGGQVAGAIGFQRGFDEYADRFDQWESLSGRDQARLEGLPPILNRVGNWLAASRAKGKPLFLFLHHYLCHDPYVKGPAEFRDRFLGENDRGSGREYREKRSSQDFWRGVDLNEPRQHRQIVSLYDGGVYYSDYVFGRLMDLLKTTGAYENSLVILLSDHGEEFNEHGGKTHGRLWDEHLHVPLLIKFPGNEHGGEVVEKPVRLMDLMPTVCDYLGIPLDHPVQGISFLPLVAGGGNYSPPIVSYRTCTSHEAIDGYSIRLLKDGYVYIRHVDPLVDLLYSQPPVRAVVAAGEIREETEPDESGDYETRGDRYFDVDYFKLASEMFQKAVELNPSEGRLLRKLASCYLEMSEFGNAEKILEEAVKISPTDHAAYLDLAKCRIAAGDYERAREIFSQARRINPDDPAVDFLEGDMLRGRGDYPGAVDLLTQAIKSKPEAVDLRAALARTLREQKEFADSAAMYKEAIMINPRDHNLYRGLLTACRDGGRFSEAVSFYRELIERYPNLTGPYYALGKYYENQDRPGEAEEVYRRLVANNPDESGGYAALGYLHLEQNRLPEAEKWFERARKIDPEQPEACLGAGLLLRRTGRYPEAERMMRKALELGVDEARGCVELGRLYGQLGKTEQAEAMFDRARTVNPDLKWRYCGISLFEQAMDRAEQNNILDREDLVEEMRALEKEVRQETVDFLRVVDRKGGREFEYDAGLSRQLKALGYMN